MNKITGTVKKVGEIKEYGSNGFTKREFVIKTEEKYPQEVKLELYKEDCGMIDAFNIGDSLEATFNIKGNEYKGNYYVNLQAWKIAKSSESNSTDQEKTQDSKKSSGGSKTQKEPKLEEEDLTENISELADAPF
jgi:single-strand DNA-binding protein